MTLQKKIERDIKKYFNNTKFAHIFVSDKNADNVYEVEKDGLIEDLTEIIERNLNDD
tara:strand:- start:243 stop:413 length:171 start_codon:yes stop_codon:yes gene_type:complete